MSKVRRRLWVSRPFYISSLQHAPNVSCKMNFICCCTHLDLSLRVLNFSCTLFFFIGINGFVLGFHNLNQHPLVPPICHLPLHIPQSPPLLRPPRRLLTKRLWISSFNRFVCFHKEMVFTEKKTKKQQQQQQQFFTCSRWISPHLADRVWKRPGNGIKLVDQSEFAI